MMDFFAKTVNDLIFPQTYSTIDIWHGSKCRSSHPKVFCKKCGPSGSGSQEKTCNRIS